ncbi:MAG: hypothetical protein NTX05_08760 [Fusobacteria bacterium]|nr:hypothetical protein [Fusobacteriota bacterium]
MWSEITVYEVRNNKQKEFERLMQEIKQFYLSQTGIIEVKLIRHKQAQTDFNRVIKESDPGQKSHIIGKVTYIFDLELESDETHIALSKSVLEQFGKEFLKCLQAPPKIIFGEVI